MLVYTYYWYCFDMNFLTDIGISLITDLEGSIGIGLLYMGITVSVLVWPYWSTLPPTFVWTLRCFIYMKTAQKLLPSCKWFSLCTRNHQQKFQEISTISELWQPFFAFTKEFPKNTKENMPPNHFCSHLSQDCQIDLLSSPDCHILWLFPKKT
jgi:hypothetical protein